MARAPLVPLPEHDGNRVDRVLRFDSSDAGLPRTRVALSSSPGTSPRVRRRLSPEGGRAIEILGHAIEYLADEYALDMERSGRLGSADPRIEAIQILKGLNRAIYFEGTEVQPVFHRMRRWLVGLGLS